MTKSTNKTIWVLALVGILVFLVWKLWPAIRNKLNSGGGSSGGAVGGLSGGNGYPYYPQQSGGNGLGGNLGFGNGGNQSTYGAATDSLNQFLQNVSAEGYNAGA
jgi:hypothetical protein